MSKDYLIVEHKDRCLECDLMRTDEMREISFCGWNGRIIDDQDGVDWIKCKMNWCPLKPVPARRKAESVSLSGQTITLDVSATGWNDCLDVILGEEKMSKRIIPIEDCFNCPDYDFYTHHCINLKKLVYELGIPENCPLPTLPEKKYFDKNFCFTSDDYVDDRIIEHLEVYGWNACCDYLTTGKDNLGEEIAEMHSYYEMLGEEE